MHSPGDHRTRESQPSTLHSSAIDGRAANAGFDDLLTEARAGSLRILCDLLEGFRGELLALARAEIGSTVVRKESASDIVQESLLDAITGFAQFHGATNHELQAWLHRIVRNRSVDVARRYRQSEMRDVSRERPLHAALLEGAVLDDDSPSECVGRHETTQRMLEAVSRLPEPYQTIVRMRYGEGKSFSSIAATLNRSPFDARRTWYAALRLLRQELTEDE